MTKILVIEDEKPLLEDILDTLTMEGFEAVGASNGLAGVQTAREMLPDLIVCDIMMPEMDGHGVLKTLRSDSITGAIPFIFLTARAESSERRAGMLGGADDYLTKPFTYDELLTAISVRLEKKAALERERLLAFSRRLVDSQEAERRRVAQTLHNEVGQSLTGLRFLLNAAAPQPGSHPDGRLAEAHRMIDDLIQRVQAISLDLRPAMLDELGLLPALLLYCEQFMLRSEMRADFQHDGLERRFGSQVETAVYRIVEEALANAARYSEAQQVTVRIWPEDGTLRLQIEDDGVGFRLEEAWLAGTSSGLDAMHERAESLGGYLVIESEPGQGTRVIASIPYSEIAPDEEVPIPHQPPPPRRQASAVIRLLLAEDYVIFRQGVRALLETEGDLEIVGETGDGLAVIGLVERLKPDVLLLDLNLPGLNGLDIARQVSRRCPQTTVLMLSLYSDEDYVLEALRNGATGYALKGTTGAELAQGVRAVAAGERYLSPPLSASALDLYQRARQGRGQVLDSYSTLTSREREVLHLVAEGYKNLEIADRLVISPRTAEAHRANLMRKLGLRTQADLVRYAVQRGLITAE